MEMLCNNNPLRPTSSWSQRANLKTHSDDNNPRRWTDSHTARTKFISQTLR